MTVAPDRGVDWRGGSLDELLAMLSGPALAGRIEVYVDDGGQERVAGEIHLLAGGVAESFVGDLRGDEALHHLRTVTPARFRVEPRVPDPDTGALDPPGPEEGALADRALASLMRYCEQNVMTCLVEVWRGAEHATISYRRGEIVATTVEGADAPERLPEVMTWKSGHYRIVLPPLVLAAMPKAKPRPSVELQPAAERVSAAALMAAAASGPPRDASGDTQRRLVPPAADARRGTVPGMPVDVFDATAPERITEVGVPAVEPRPVSVPSEPPSPTAATVVLREKVPSREVSPTERKQPSVKVTAAERKKAEKAEKAQKAERKQPSVKVTPAERADVSARSTAPGYGAASDVGTTTPGLPREPKQAVVASPSGGVHTLGSPKKPRGRSLGDLPVLVHIAIGLALGLSIVGSYWAVQSFLPQ